MEMTAEQKQIASHAVLAAQRILDPGDVLTVRRCGGTLARITFAGWDGQWLRSKSGRAEDHPANVIRINGSPVDFAAEGEIVAKYFAALTAADAGLPF